MRSRPGRLCSIIAVSICSVCGADELQPEKSAAFDLKRTELGQRIDDGDFAAFNDVAELPASVAIPFLWWYARLAAHPARNAARAALKKVHGYAPFFRTKLAEATAKRGVDETSFEILSVIATPEAVAVVAPYLFDYTTCPSVDPQFSSVNAISAALALGRMKLANAPSPEEPNKVDDVVDWQMWAVKHDLVPKEWILRVGQGDFIRQMRDLEKAVASPQPPSSSRQELKPPTH